MKYYYFVSYFFEDGYKNGHGFCQAVRNEEITSIEDVKDVASSIAKLDNFSGVVILNYILLRKETI